MYEIDDTFWIYIIGNSHNPVLTDTGMFGWLPFTIIRSDDKEGRSGKYTEWRCKLDYDVDGKRESYVFDTEGVENRSDKIVPRNPSMGGADKPKKVPESVKKQGY